MQISLRKRAFPTILYKCAEGLTRNNPLSYNMGQAATSNIGCHTLSYQPLLSFS